jgi:hypothetical protein
MPFHHIGHQVSSRIGGVARRTNRLLAFCFSVCAMAALAATLIGCGATSTTSVGPSPVKCEVALSSTTNPVAQAGGAATVVIATQPECAWTASENVTWISQPTPASGQGSGEVGFQVAANPTQTSRQGEIRINDIPFQLSQDGPGCSFQLGSTSTTVPVSGGMRSVALTAVSGCTWTATSQDSWIVITSGASGNGNGTVNFTVAANVGTARTGTLTIAGQTFTVTQAGSCTASIQPTSQSIGFAGGTGSAAVTSNPGCAWTSTSNAPWITVTSGATGVGNGNVTFGIAANSSAARSGTLTIAGQTFTVNQATGCSYSINPTSQSIGSAGGNGSSSVTANSGCAWTASSNASWIAVTSGASGNGNGNVAFSIAANTGNPRTGTLTIAGQTFTVNQARLCTYTLQPPSVSVGASASNGSTMMNASNGCSWTATSNAAWLTITSGSSGNGNGNIAFTIAANTGPARTGTLTIGGQTFTVNQANGCTYTLSSMSASFTNLGGTGSVMVTTAAGCTWTAVSNVPWITVTSGLSGNGNGTVSYAVGVNLSGTRNGTMTIAGRTFTVSQGN